MSDKWNVFFEKVALEDLQATTPPNPNAGEIPENEAEQAGENAEKNINESSAENNGTEGEVECKTKTKSEKGTENNEGSEQKTGTEETV